MRSGFWGLPTLDPLVSARVSDERGRVLDFNEAHDQIVAYKAARKRLGIDAKDGLPVPYISNEEAIERAWREIEDAHA